ncbi:hypothetical protein BV22DRAFT_1191661 [Leucogyrophana mollusca]|uniref:Uncharacterized protein n=1 Tax=Leucogyrophana mollusca TaxID=85980 RepID=A0ACB8BWS7_9AGAM|nr:hypothetical protein BV22DRAFT_1191661 [Leucogyrophana mollusca]
MHQCLTLPEILLHIFSHVCYKETLLSLAITCKAFKEPALDTLYWELKSFEDLLRCLPRDIWETWTEFSLASAEYQLMDFMLMITQAPVRPVDTNDWAIFEAYASRVRHLFDNSFLIRSSDIPDSVFRTLCFAPAHILCPNLRSLSWTMGSKACNDFLRLLLGPQLVTLTLRGNNGGFSQIPPLPVLCPHLQNLTLRHGTADDDLAGILRDLPNLRSFHCQGLPERALAQVAQLPLVQSLGFAITSQTSYESITQVASPIFPSLKSLYIDSDRMTSCVDFFHSIHDPLNATRLVLRRRYDRGHINSLKSLSVAISVKCAPLHLSCIELSEYEVDEGWEDFSEELHPLIDDIRPLFAFPNLTTLVLNFCITLWLDDNALEDMAKAWPRLRTLDITRLDSQGKTSGITFKGLFSLLRFCRDFTTLGIVIDATVIQPHWLIPDESVRNTLVREIDVNLSAIKQPAYVAAILSAALPNLSAIRSGSMILTGWSKYKRRWEQTEELLKVFSLMRKQERARLCGDKEWCGGEELASLAKHEPWEDDWDALSEDEDDDEGEGEGEGEGESEGEGEGEGESEGEGEGEGESESEGEDESEGDGDGEDGSD